MSKAGQIDVIEEARGGIQVSGESLISNAEYIKALEETSSEPSTSSCHSVDDDEDACREGYEEGDDKLTLKRPQWMEEETCWHNRDSRVWQSQLRKTLGMLQRFNEKE